MSTNKVRPATSPNSCGVCRARKRRCDRQLPTCSYCFKRKKPCDYKYLERQSSLELRNDHKILSINKEAARTHEAPQYKISALYFLATDIFLRHGVDGPDQSKIMPLPRDIKQHIGDSVAQQRIADHFFRTTHRWLPIVARKRFIDSLNTGLGLELPADVGFLLLGMRLVTWFPGLGADNSHPPGLHMEMYRVARQFCLETELAGILSLRILQCRLLIAIYEIGHGIYPAAAISVARCVRYGQALGIQPSHISTIRLPMTLVEAEEKKRVWWAIFLFDKLISIVCPSCPSLVEHPRPDDLLPADDDLWDKEEITAASSTSISQPSSMIVGRFALTVQISILLSRVLQAIPHQNEENRLSTEELLQLQRTIMALMSFGSAECKPPIQLLFCELRALCKIALLALHGFPQLSKLQPSRIVEFPWESWKETDWEAMMQRAAKGNDQISPFIVHATYQSVALIFRGGGKITAEEISFIDASKRGLMALNKRWKLAGIFLQAVEAHEVASQTQ